ncbi:Pentatricopeptide repeat-containing protein -mitochondrial [Striga hermonthica]|uniref:Pentatricopeptide repeat-containing protein -mitochondrial n=1 Tax=Striga hermonthica TaxID=68872 RepID=A0A9N7RPY0_STRHE|nr:Pentatricopeptide repeat-containing protein -mitochondrial [Striga hermonthica]
MSPFLAFRGGGGIRRFSTAATSSAAKLTISQTKKRLRNTHDPDEVLKIYSSFAATNDLADSSTFAATRFFQELAVGRLVKSQRFSDIKNFLESHKSNPQIAQEPFVSSIIRSYGVAGMFENAVNTYNEMDDLGSPRTSLSLNSLLYACVHSKVFDRVPVYFEEYPLKFGFEPDNYAYAMLIKAYCEMGSPEMGMEKLRDMEEKGMKPCVVCFSTILDGLYKKGSVNEAEKFWTEMVNGKGILPDVGCYNVRLSHIQEGNLEAVKALLEDMENDGIKPNTITYNYLITCYCVNGMMDEAMKVYHDDLLKAKGHNPNSTTFRTLVFHLCKNKRFVTACKVFKKSVHMGKIPDFNTLKYLVEGLAKNGHMDEAKGMVQTMNKKFHPNLLKAWDKIANELGLAGDVAQNVDSGGEEKEAELADHGSTCFTEHEFSSSSGVQLWSPGGINGNSSSGTTKDQDQSNSSGGPKENQSVEGSQGSPGALMSVVPQSSQVAKVITRSSSQIGDDSDQNKKGKELVVYEAEPQSNLMEVTIQGVNNPQAGIHEIREQSMTQGLSPRPMNTKIASRRTLKRSSREEGSSTKTHFPSCMEESTVPAKRQREADSLNSSSLGTSLQTEG